MRAVQYDRYGDLDVLEVREVPDPTAGDGEVLVEVRAAGVNPGEVAIREGRMAETTPWHFPSGQGTEFSGVVRAVGARVSDVAVGDEVIGFSDGRDAQAELVAVPADHVLPKPAGMDWLQAAVLPVGGATAIAMAGAVGPLGAGTTVVVAGAAGGVGYPAAQLVRRTGARVIGTCSGDDASAVRQIGVTPVQYGDGVAGRIRAAAPDGVDAFLDTHGGGQADIAVELGVAPERIDSIIDFEAGGRLGIRTIGMYQLPDLRAAVVDFAALVASQQVWAPVKTVFTLDQVRDAYRALTDAPGVGKIVLDVSVP